MGKETEFVDLIKRMMPQPIIPCMMAVVKSVENTTCTVVFPDGYVQSEVRLKASIDESMEYVIIKPRINTTVLVTPLGDETAGEYYVVAVNEIDVIEVMLKKDKVALIMDEKGVELQVKNNTVLINSDIVEMKTKGCSLRVTETNLEIESDYPISLKATQTDLKEVLNSILDCSRYMSILTGAVGSISPVAPVHNQFSAKASILIDRLLA